MTLSSIPKTAHHGETTFVTFKLKKNLNKYTYIMQFNPKSDDECRL